MQKTGVTLKAFDEKAAQADEDSEEEAEARQMLIRLIIGALMLPHHCS